jgi:hypothetical protein
VVIIDDFERITAGNSEALRYLQDKPYYICFSLCLLAAAMPVRDANARRSSQDRIQLKPVFDSHEEYSGIAGSLFASFVEKNPRAAEVLLPPSYDDDVKTVALQVADTLAYEARKLLTRQIRDPDRDYMRVPMIRLRPSIYRLYRLDYAALQTIVTMQSRDAIAVPHARVEQIFD